MMKPAYLPGRGTVSWRAAPRATRSWTQFIAQTKQEQPGGVEPLPEVKPYESFFYTDASLRSPFVPGGNGDASCPGVRPDVQAQPRVPRAVLARHAVDGRHAAHGQPAATAWSRPAMAWCTGWCPAITSARTMAASPPIEPSRISVTEIVPDGLGGYMERTASIALNE